MITFLFILSWMLSSIFLFLNHPLSLGLILLIQTIAVSLLSGLMNLNYWFSYIIFLIMVGGMLVLFIYMTSVASNEKFKFSSKLFILALVFLLLTFILIMTDQFFMSNNLHTFELTNQNLPPSNKLTTSKYMNWPSSSIMFTIISYLLLTMISVVKITTVEYGPLRQKF
uniref:NADH-ubiquinone oxidoreductase chain 6 n=1 Tax=Aeolesthes oenochrous TaxID=1162206 RepID=A0A090AN95_9CUCU|nr:NADH dehydrogenase subunit 6 [Aeolesthes oenochrous]BAP59129.1 NADH dehydrogenase subunit 6 [Aeolesthes oenochrous]